jgi:2-aminoadipate transaminase
MDWQSIYAGRMELLALSRAGAEILKLAERPDVISFAGGLPDPRSFPLEPMREALERVVRDEGSTALNYGSNLGYSKLRDWIAERMWTREQIQISRDNVLVTSGGVEALNLICMALLNAGDTVVVGAPTYLIALHVLRAYEVNIVPVRLDTEGLDTGELEDRLGALERQGVTPKLIYVIPSFQNPSGITLSKKRREHLVDVCRRFRVPVVEDHAYGDLRYEGEPLPTLKSLAPDQVILTSTFSKIFAPGVRLGWIAADAELVDHLGLCKVGTDSCSSTIGQRLVHTYGSQGGIEAQVMSSITLYRRKRDLLLQALDREMPKDVSWTSPQGGFYVWLSLPENADSEKLLSHAIEREKTAFVAGPPFFADGSGQANLRLAYSFVPEGQIEEGVKRVARAMRAYKKRSQPSSQKDPV